MLNNSNQAVMEKYIFVEIVKSNRSDNSVYAVRITGEEQPQAFCKSARATMKFVWLLKKRTGVGISQNSLSRLSQEIAAQREASLTDEQRAQRAAIEQQVEELDNHLTLGHSRVSSDVARLIDDFCESHSVDNVLAQPQEAEPKPKRQRKPRTSKKQQAEVVALS